MDNHKSHRPGTFEEWEQRMITSGQKGRDEYEFYKRSNFALPRTWFVADCPLCIEVAEKKAKYEEDMRRQDEEYMQRQKEWEEAEKAKPKPPPPAPAPPKPKIIKTVQTPQELEEWRALCEQEKTMMQELARIRARIAKLNPTNDTYKDEDYCKVCDCDYTGGGNYVNSALRKRHLASRKHQLRVGLIQEDVYPKHCDKCDFDAKTKHYWEQHCKGRKHRILCEKREGETNMDVVRRLNYFQDEQSCVVPTTDDFSATDNGTP